MKMKTNIEESDVIEYHTCDEILLSLNPKEKPVEVNPRIEHLYVLKIYKNGNVLVRNLDTGKEEKVDIHHLQFLKWKKRYLRNDS